MKKIVVVLLGMISLAGFAGNSVAAMQQNNTQNAELSSGQARLVVSTVTSAVNAATTTVGAAVVSGTIISHIG